MADPQRILRVDDHPLPNRPAAGDGLVRVLTLHRPERKNALSPELIEALLAAITQAGPPVRALVLTGSGDRFCAGGDLGAGGLMGEGMLAQHQQRQRYAELLAAMASSPIPILAAVHGDAMGGGFGLAAACHIVVADPAAGFATPELKLGLFPFIISPVLARSLPAKVLYDLILTGRRLPAAEAAALGFCALSEPGEALNAAIERASLIAERSPAVVSLGLRAMAQVADLPLPAALEHMTGQLSLNLLTEDAAEGISAFFGRRSPDWKGR
jgi:enoyl-CoA hydratase/carnithine racemase